MSGAWAIRGAPPGEHERLAALVSGQMAMGGEPVNRYAADGEMLLGLVSHDVFGQGPMPRYLAEEGMWAVLQGELHESEALDAARASLGAEDDATLLARLVRENRHLGTLPHLNGAFFALLYRPDDQTLWAMNDRYGLYPMYWAEGRGRFCLASRVLASVLSGAAPGEWDAAGAAQILACDDIIGDTTLVRGVKAYPPATVMRLGPNGPEWSRYWQYTYRADPAPNLAEWGARLGDGLVRAVRRQTVSARRVGVTLSGGLDSRSLVAAAQRAGLPVATYTWGDPDCGDRRIAALVAERLGAEHHDYDYRYDALPACYRAFGRVVEGMNNLFDAHMLMNLDRLGDVDLVLNGFAGDLVLGGSYLRNRWATADRRGELARRVFAWRNQIVPEAELHEALADPSLLGPGDLPSSRYADLIPRYDQGTVHDRLDAFFLENRVRRVTATGTVMMRCQVESAACFFEYDLLDTIQAVPGHLRKDHIAYRAMLRTTFPQAARIEWLNTGLPAAAPPPLALAGKAILRGRDKLSRLAGCAPLAGRRKVVDFGSPLRGPLRDWAESVIRPARSADSEVVAPGYVERLWARVLAGEAPVRPLGAFLALRSFGEALATARRREAATACRPEAAPAQDSQ